MYNVSVGPSKIVAKTRRGISQNLESFQNFSRKPIDFDNGEVLNVPKPVFNTSNKKFSNNKQQEIISPQHEELIRFVSESWRKIFKEYESDGLDESENICASSIMYYEDPEPNIFIQNFKPFDLESWWGKRLLLESRKLILKPFAPLVSNFRGLKVKEFIALGELELRCKNCYFERKDGIMHVMRPTNS